MFEEMQIATSQAKESALNRQADSCEKLSQRLRSAFMIIPPIALTFLIAAACFHLLAPTLLLI